MAVVALVVWGLVGLVVASPAAAANAPILVTNSGATAAIVNSLPWAVQKANADAGADTILFDMATVTTPIVLTADLDQIIDDLTIVGPGEALLTIDAPNTVFDIAGAAPPIAVVISDLTITSAGVSACGISSDDADVTVTNVTASDFDCSGISVQDGSLTATDVTVERDANGIAFVGADATDILTLTRIHSDGADFSGVNAVVSGAVATITDIDANDAGIFGVLVATEKSGNSAISQVRADRAGVVGVTVLTDTGATASLSDSSAAAGVGQGINLQATASSTLTATRVTATGNASSGLWLSVTDSATLTVQSSLVQDTIDDSGIWIDQVDDATLTISGTRVLNNTSDFGGGIELRQATGGATVTITGSTISGNHATDDGGGIDVDSVADDGTTLTISDSTISGNSSVDFGGGLYLHDVGAGATNTARVVIQRATFDSNYGGGYGAALAIDGIAPETSGLPKVLIDSSTLSNNITPYGGGGIHVRNPTGPGTPVVKLLNSTISGNDAQVGGGFDASGSPLAIVISHSTIADNSAHTSGGVAADPNTLQLDNSILSGAFSNNGNTPDDLDVGGPLVAQFSLVQAPRPGVPISTAGGNILGVDPLLAPLANNGGSTMTRLVAPGSPAYNAGDPAFAGAGLFDQRGQARVFQRVDMGAVEWHPALAHTGSELTPRPLLIAFLLLFSGVAMVAFSRLRTVRAVA